MTALPDGAPRPPAAAERVGIVGCGLMGSGIAEVVAAAGLDVLAAVSRPASRDRGLGLLRGSLDRAVDRGRRTAEERAEILGRIRFTTDPDDLADRTLVIEAVSEDERIKQEVFGRLDKIVEADDAVLASTTSAIPIMRLGRATSRPERVVGMHFFNPVPAMRLVELVPSLATDGDATERATAFVAGTLGKEPIRCADRTGFVVNTLLIPYLLAAVRMVESGAATPEVVDRAMVLGCAHPQGPLKLADLIGLDSVAAIAEALYAEFREPLYSPPPLLSRMVECGLLGRKSGRGFYAYT
ncbi:3-hydroxybutyryl-CoA dehydrogenase [Spirillospora albida]|uniref:3-hydroxybutyryl-CoA dehydrogenase n=1 Tax=Spirillospora albida TaxID=58123 RepID=UPI000B31357A|nr:3-hydroxybutyryl-CoA dehydrogenase [Spirillospora albida]